MLFASTEFLQPGLVVPDWFQDFWFVVLGVVNRRGDLVSVRQIVGVGNPTGIALRSGRQTQANIPPRRARV